MNKIHKSIKSNGQRRVWSKRSHLIQHDFQKVTFSQAGGIGSLCFEAHPLSGGCTFRSLSGWSDQGVPVEPLG